MSYFISSLSHIFLPVGELRFEKHEKWLEFCNYVNGHGEEEVKNILKYYQRSLGCFSRCHNKIIELSKHWKNVAHRWFWGKSKRFCVCSWLSRRWWRFVFFSLKYIVLVLVFFSHSHLQFSINIYFLLFTFSSRKIENFIAVGKKVEKWKTFSLLFSLILSRSFPFESFISKRVSVVQRNFYSRLIRRKKSHFKFLKIARKIVHFKEKRRKIKSSTWKTSIWKKN
jgi:hypothetical protein